ncbi:hypothetical protein PJ985_00560 [Streptomyces sp. ACA25]|uniref:hypothetical protein n=1 Tax=Streptomyces sp. ACA25 TaxID=3022596 RepID=UPI002307F197|nr:hypothetical protein [Streptomyces sp. ACA25]MDB1086074.1 hypothetical protein [Streptomyces sp. ACA25]
MLENHLNRRSAEFGVLAEETQGHITEQGAPVLATPAALAFTAGAAAVVGAYVAGRGEIIR